MARPDMEPASLVELLCWRAQEQPEQRAYIFLNDRGQEDGYVTYAEVGGAPPVTRPKDKPSLHLLTLSAQTAAGLQAQAQNFRTFFTKENCPPFGDICFTTQCGRTHFSYRLAVVGASPEEFLAKLSAWLEGHMPAGLSQGRVLKWAPQTPRQTYTFVDSMPTTTDEWQGRLEELGTIYVRGGAIDWRSLHRNQPRRLTDLPTYPFQRKRYWLGTAL